MQAAEQSGGIVEAAFYLVRLFAQILILLGAVAICRWGIRTFLLYRGGKSDRWRKSYSAINLIILVLLLVLRMPAERSLTFLSGSISPLRPGSQLGWLPPMLAGIYYALIASSILFLAIHVVGLAYWFAERGSMGGSRDFVPTALSNPAPGFTPAEYFGSAPICFLPFWRVP